jgi:hypothetical protein
MESKFIKMNENNDQQVELSRGERLNEAMNLSCELIFSECKRKGEKQVTASKH